jgi:hypothetical protein
VLAGPASPGLALAQDSDSSEGESSPDSDSSETESSHAGVHEPTSTAEVGASNGDGDDGAESRPTETPAQEWTRLCSSAGIGRYGESSGVYSVDVVRLGDAAQGTFVEASYTDLAIGETNTVEVPATGDFGEYSVTCRAGERVAFVARVFADGSTISPFELRNSVRARLVIPEPQVQGSPPLTERFSVVQIPTWFWIENWDDSGLAESDSAGGLSVSVTATPIEAVWDPGDGNPKLVCDAGLQWTPDTPEHAATCAHTYTKSTAGLPNDALAITTDLTWELSWTLNGADQGVFATFTSTTITPHQVDEIQIINTSN